MDTNTRTNLEYLLQADLLANVIPALGTEQWQPLYVSQHSRPDRFGLYCALLGGPAAEQAVQRDGWDLKIGDGLPGFSGGYARDGKIDATYHRFGDSRGVRPLVVYRDFHGVFPDYVELCEEFRHYHNLADDPKRGLLLDFDDSGYEIEVARIAPKQVDVRLRYLKQFLAGTRLHLGIYIDSVRYSKIPLDQIAEDQRELIVQQEFLRYRRDIVKCDHIPEYATFSRVLSTVVIPPGPLERAGIWPFEPADDREVTFIVGVDGDGEPVEHTSNHEKLGNYFGANADAPHYLTPIYFRKEVLGKYYADPDRYSVSDGRLSCFALWGCQIDNNHPTHVVVFLGDLGRDLPYEERLHWKQFNVPPEGGVSEPNYRRSFLAQWAAPQAPDLIFREEYERLNKCWHKSQGWPPFLKPAAGDTHLLETIHIPVTNSQSELDEQVLALTKLLIDSLNEKEIESHGGTGEAGEKGITKFARFLTATGFEQTEAVVSFLRDLQALRSAGSGHRKGKRYDQIIADLGIDPKNKPAVMSRLLEEATVVLSALGLKYCTDYRPVGEQFR